MNYVKKLTFSTLLFLCASVCFQLVFTCERFEPDSELYFYADTVTQASRGSYTFHGGAVNIGDDEIIQHGFCWSDSKSPTLERDSLSSLGSLPMAGKFSSMVTGAIVRHFRFSSAGHCFSAAQIVNPLKCKVLCKGLYGNQGRTVLQ